MARQDATLSSPRRARDEPLVRCRAVRKRYQLGSASVEALRGVDLELEGDESLALLGPSGSGKSTLLNLIGGLDRPTSGDVAVGGRELAALSRDELARHRRATVGFVFQQFRLLAHLTALENVALPRVLAGADRAAAQREAVGLLEPSASRRAARIGHRSSPRESNSASPSRERS